MYLSTWKSQSKNFSAILSNVCTDSMQTSFLMDDLAEVAMHRNENKRHLV